MKPLFNSRLVALLFALMLVSAQLTAAEEVARCGSTASLTSLFAQLRLLGSSQSTVAQSKVQLGTAASGVIYCSEQGDPFDTCNGCNQSGCTCDSSHWWYSVCCCDASVE